MSINSLLSLREFNKILLIEFEIFLYFEGNLLQKLINKLCSMDKQKLKDSKFFMLQTLYSLSVFLYT